MMLLFFRCEGAVGRNQIGGLRASYLCVQLSCVLQTNLIREAVILSEESKLST